MIAFFIPKIEKREFLEKRYDNQKWSFYRKANIRMEISFIVISAFTKFMNPEFFTFRNEG